MSFPVSVLDRGPGHDILYIIALKAELQLKHLKAALFSGGHQYYTSWLTGLMEDLNGPEPSLMILVPPELFLLSQVPDTAMKKHLYAVQCSAVAHRTVCVYMCVYTYIYIYQ